MDPVVTLAILAQLFLFICSNICLFPPAHPPIRSSTSLIVYLFICLFVCLFVCLFIVIVNSTQVGPRLYNFERIVVVNSA